ncbi:MAG: hypothetical protein ABIF01_00675 [Candidatus Micrarchaeota archaeon]
MMPLPPDAVNFLATISVILGFLGIVLLRGRSFKSKIIYVLLLECFLITTILVWYALSSVHILTELETYQAGRQVRVFVSIFGAPYTGGLFLYQSGPYSMEKKSGYSFYRLEGSNWVWLDTECRDCWFRDCVDGEIVGKGNLISGPCAQVTDKAYVWNQTAYVLESRECAGKPYNTYVQKPAGPGRYKVELCYGRAFNFDWDFPQCAPMQNVEPTCAESYFWIRN